MGHLLLLFLLLSFSRANKLPRNKIRPESIIRGYKLAMMEACTYVEENLAVKVENLRIGSLVNFAKSSMNSYLKEHSSDSFAKQVVGAILAATTSSGKVTYPIYVKDVYTSVAYSYLLKGYALISGYVCHELPRRARPARVACLNFGMEIKLGELLSKSKYSQMFEIHQREIDIILKGIDRLSEAGASVILTTEGIDAIFFELDCFPTEKCARSFLGNAEEIVATRIADADVIVFLGLNEISVSSALNAEYGPDEKERDESSPDAENESNESSRDEKAKERYIRDTLAIVKRTLECDMVVGGGGAVEAALSVYLGYLPTTLGLEEQLAIKEFAESLLIIPKVLVLSAHKCPSMLAAKVLERHHFAPTKADKRQFSRMRLDLESAVVQNNLKAQVVEPADNESENYSACH